MPRFLSCRTLFIAGLVLTLAGCRQLGARPSTNAPSAPAFAPAASPTPLSAPPALDTGTEPALPPIPGTELGEPESLEASHDDATAGYAQVPAIEPVGTDDETDDEGQQLSDMELTPVPEDDEPIALPAADPLPVNLDVPAFVAELNLEDESAPPAPAPPARLATPTPQPPERPAPVRAPWETAAQYPAMIITPGPASIPWWAERPYAAPARLPEARPSRTKLASLPQDRADTNPENE